MPSSSLPPNTGTIRKAHEHCKPREGTCSDHDDVYSLCDETDRLTAAVFALELALNDLSKPVSDLAKAQSDLFAVRKLHQADSTSLSGARVCLGCGQYWPCSTRRLIGSGS